VFTVLILFFLNLSINISNSTINANERTINYNDGQIHQIFIAKLTGSQEIPFVNTDVMRTALFKENLLKNGSRIQLNKVRKVTDWLSTYIHLKPYLSYPLFEKGFFY